MAKLTPWLLAGTSGVLLALAYPGLSWWPLAFVAYVPLLWALRSVERVRRGAALGAVAGAVLHGISFAWLSFTMREMSGLPVAVGWLVVVLHAVAMGLHQAAFAAVLTWTHRWRERWWWPVWVGGALVAAELVVPWQFPWYLGNTVYRVPILLQPADLIGVVGLSGALAAFSALLVRLWATRRWPYGAVAALLVVGWLGYGAMRQAQVEAAEPHHTWTIGVVQHNPSLKEKRSLKPGPRLPMFKRAVAMTRTLPLETLDLVVWAEGTLPFFYVPTELDQPGRAPPVLRKVTAEVQKLAAGLGRPLLFGTLRMLDRQWKQRPRNAAVVLDGRQEQAYDKHLLVPFGEYLPGRDLIPSLKDAVPGVSDLGAGTSDGIVPLRGVRLGMSICYEALFMGFMWEQTRSADLLVNLTDDVWFGPTNAPELHLMVQTPRAVELRRPLLRATATGVSALIDAQGRITGRTPVYKPATRVVSAQMRHVDSPFRWWGPWPGRGIALGVVLLTAWAPRRRET